MKTGINVNLHYIPSPEYPFFFSSPAPVNQQTGERDVENVERSGYKHMSRFFKAAEERDAGMAVMQKEYPEGIFLSGMCKFDD